MIHSLNNLEARELLPGFHGKFIHSENMTFAYWEIKKGCLLPEHSHPHEQVANMLEGKFEIIIDGISTLLEPGDVGVIPSNAIHSGKALTDCKILDVFSPVREDYQINE